MKKEKLIEYLDLLFILSKPSLILFPIGLVCYLIFNTPIIIYITIIAQVSWIVMILGSFCCDTS